MDPDELLQGIFELGELTELPALVCVGNDPGPQATSVFDICIGKWSVLAVECDGL